ncbi:MAG: hypothetical protein V4677_05695 [Bacteroidota bacterium]
MHKIGLHNYEAYLLDLSEGNLSDEGQMELELFLIQHPELQINLDELSSVLLDSETVSFSDKANLKRTDEDLVSGAQFIAYVENQLTDKERLEIEKSCSVNPSLLKELVLYNSTIAKADESIVFENKEFLKRKPKVIWFNFSATQYAAAACVAFLIGLFMLWPQTEEGVHSTLAEKTNTTKTDVQTSVNTNNSQHNIETVATPKESTNSLAQNAHSNKIQQQTLANNTTTNIISQENNVTNESIIPPVNNNQSIEQPPKNEIFVAQNTAPSVKQKTVVQVISENDDELVVSNEPVKKKGIWAAASRALKNLNHAGVKGVDGNEENSKENTAYALTLGGVSITHKAGKL